MAQQHEVVRVQPLDVLRHILDPVLRQYQVKFVSNLCSTDNVVCMDFRPLTCACTPSMQTCSGTSTSTALA